MLADHGLALLDCESSEREHTNLCGHMIPGTLSANLLEILPEGSSHGVHTLGDHDELIEPLLSHVWLVKDDGCDSSTELWWR